MSKALTPIEDLRGSLEKLKPQIRAALPGHIKADKFVRVLMTAVSTTPALVDASRSSLFGACLKLAASGLMPDGKEAAIVTFKLKDGTVQATAMPMISGILKLVRNSGDLASISPGIVCANDEFDYWVDENGDHLKHRPNLKEDRGDMILAYAVAITKDGAKYIEVMSKKEIEKVRNSSRAKDGGPWSQWYDEMSKKTVLRRLAKRLPMSTDIEDAVKADDEMYDVTPAAQTQPALDTQEKKSKSKKLADVIETAPIKNHADDIQAEDAPL